MLTILQPPDGPSYGCPQLTKDTCTSDSSPDMWENYMDYTDDACMSVFTTGQKNRMTDCLVNLRSESYTIVGQNQTPPNSNPGVLTLVDNLSNVNGGIIASSSQNNWANSGATTNLVYGSNPGHNNGLYFSTRK